MERAKKSNPQTNDPFYKTIVIIDEAHKLYTKDLKTQERLVKSFVDASILYA